MINVKEFIIVIDFENDMTKTFISIDKLIKIIYSMNYKQIIIETRINKSFNIDTKQIKDYFIFMDNIKKTYSINLRRIVQCYLNSVNDKIIRLIAKKKIYLELHVDLLELMSQSIKNVLKLYKRKRNLVKFNINIIGKELTLSEIYQKLKIINIPFVFDINGYSSNEINEMFSNWFLDKRGIDYSFFSQCFKMLLFNTKIDLCKYNSCLGKTLYLSSNGDLSFCKINKKNTIINNIENVESYSDIFNSNFFLDIINNTKQYRNKCKDECNYFSKCQGGCPINTNKENFDNNCKENNYIELLDYINETLKIVFNSNTNLNEINPLAKQDILNAISYDTNIKQYLN